MSPAFDTIDAVAAAINVDRAVIDSVSSRVDRHYRKFEVVKPSAPDKRRVVYNPLGNLRLIQRRLYRRLILPRCGYAHYSHGVRGRSTKTSLARHVGQQFLFTADIADFYPSIHYTRVADVFASLGCSAAVTNCLTRLCTADYCVPQGFMTSPILADLVFRHVDSQIGRLCERAGAVYTRFVDDIAVSAGFDLEGSGIPKSIGAILRRFGFRANRRKSRFGSLDRGATTLGLRVNNGHVDVTAEYYAETERRLLRAAAYGDCGAVEGPLYTRDELWGRMQYVNYINPRRRRTLLPLWRRIDWAKVEGRLQAGQSPGRPA